MSDSISSDEEASALFREAYVLEENGALDDALAIRKRLLTHDPNDEDFILVLARSLENSRNHDEAETLYRKSIFIHPYSELSSLLLFHFLWRAGRSDDAFIEIKRFQSISHSEDYLDIVREINAKTD